MAKIDFTPAIASGPKIDFQPLQHPTEEQKLGTPGPTRAEARTFLSEVPELAAGTAMSVASAAKGTPAAMALTGLAGAGGEAFRQIGERSGILNTKAPDTSSEAMSRMVDAAIRNGLGELIGRKVVSPALKWAFAPGASGVTPALESGRQAAESVGIEAPVSTLTDAKIIQGTERGLEYSPFGAAITKQRQAALDSFGKYSETVGDKIAPNQQPDLTGNMAKAELEAFKQRADKARDELYKASLPQLANQPVDVTPLAKTLKDIIKRRSGTAEPAGLGKVKEWLADISPNSTEVGSARGKYIPATEKVVGSGDFMTSPQEVISAPGQFVGNKNGPLKVPTHPSGMLYPKPEGSINTFNDLRKFRTNVAAMTHFNNPATSGLNSDLRQVNAVVTGILDDAAGKVSPEALAAIKKADEYTANGFATLKSKVFNAILKSPPENAHEIVFVPNSPSQYELGKEILGDQLPNVARQWFNDIVKPNPDGSLSPAKIATRLTKYGSTVDALAQDFPGVGEEIAKLKQIALLLTKGREVTQGSQTAYIWGSLGAAASAVFKLLSNPAELPHVAAGVAATGLGVKGLLSDTGREYLTRGFPKVGAAAGRVVRTAGQLGAQQISEKE